MRTGIANLPLHYGTCPPWLFERMHKLSKAIIAAILVDYSSDEVLRRLADPFWFQAFGNVLGFDWHSSGISTTVMASVKEGLRNADLGIGVAGGKGKTSCKAPEQIQLLGEQFSLSDSKTGEVVYASRLSSKVDNSAVRDDYSLYMHSLVLTEKGKWTVIQQGLNDKSQYARRYHWLSDSVKDFVNEPHEAICCDARGSRVLNLTAKQSKETRSSSVDLVKDNPEHLRRYFKPKSQSTLGPFPRPAPKVKTLDMPQRINWKALEAAYEFQPRNYEELLLTRGLGPKTVRALALISELIYGTEPSWSDPAKFAFAVGGKDGVPYSVNKERYDKSIQILQDAIDSAKINNKEKLEALRRLRSF